MLKESQQFTVSFLEKSQQDLAEKFFKPQEKVGDKLGDVDYYFG